MRYSPQRETAHRERGTEREEQRERTTRERGERGQHNNNDWVDKQISHAVKSITTDRGLFNVQATPEIQKDMREVGKELLAQIPLRQLPL